MIKTENKEQKNSKAKNSISTDTPESLKDQKKIINKKCQDTPEDHPWGRSG